MSFDTLGLAPSLLRAVSEQGYTTPTPIQARAIPEILAGRDLLAAAQTGTGKTAAFTLPMLQKLQAAAPAEGKRAIRVLVLVPTRELAAQVEESVRTYSKHLPAMRTTLIFGGVSINPQIDSLRRGTDIVVATPGRLLDHVGQRTIDLSKVEFLVLDEADRMLDMGFIPDIEKICKLVPFTRQTLFFSATMPPEPDVLGDVLAGHPQARRRPAAQSGDDRHRAAQQRRRGRTAARDLHRQGQQGRPARLHDQPLQLEAGAGVHAYQAWRQPPG